MNDPIVIATARRTPFGRFLRSLAGYSAVELGTVAARAALEPVSPKAIDRVVVGQAFSAGCRGNAARQIGLAAGVPETHTAYTVSLACASGAQAFVNGVQSIEAGETEAVLCGGIESMSNVPHLIRSYRQGTKLGTATIEDGLLVDGLRDWDGFSMGEKAEWLVHQGGGRAEQDAYAERSHRLAASAYRRGYFDAELVPLPELTRDEQLRPDTTPDRLSRLKPAFADDGSITAGNGSGINDGAAMLVLCRRSRAAHHGWPALASVRAYAVSGGDPRFPGTAPVEAIRHLVSETGLPLDQFHHVEINEAFAVQLLACQNALLFEPSRVNPDGGAIALGHPFAASGARIIVHLAHAIASGRARLGLAAVAAAGGMAIAVALEKLT